MEQSKLDRISELSRKSRITPLTNQEKEEQAQLRQEYLSNIRRNFRSVLEGVEVRSEPHASEK